MSKSPGSCRRSPLVCSINKKSPFDELTPVRSPQETPIGSALSPTLSPAGEVILRSPPNQEQFLSTQVPDEWPAKERALSPPRQSKEFFLRKIRISKIVLGEGSFSKVRLGLCLQTFRSVAVKMIDKRMLSEKNLQHYKKELHILLYLREHRHPNIVELLDFYEDEKVLVLVFPQYDCDLYELLDNQELSESQVRPIFRQVIDALNFLHSHKIAHCDVKAENVLVDLKTGRIALTDFGFADFSCSHDSLNRYCGSIGYVAPEILTNHSYGPSVDVWSAGVLLFVLLCRRLPFFDEDEEVEFKRTLKAEFKFRKRDKLSKEARAFLRASLTADPKKRSCIRDLVTHAFIRR